MLNTRYSSKGTLYIQQNIHTINNLMVSYRSIVQYNYYEIINKTTRFIIKKLLFLAEK